jgi:Fe-S cluster assembly ATPase SufC
MDEMDSGLEQDAAMSVLEEIKRMVDEALTQKMKAKVAPPAPAPEAEKQRRC